MRAESGLLAERVWSVTNTEVSGGYGGYPEAREVARACNARIVPFQVSAERA
jgi:hypothetical protein